jgi:hypothetical protein
MNVQWQVMSVYPHSTSELRTEINEMSCWMSILPVQYLGISWCCISRRKFGFRHLAATCLKLFQSMVHSSVAVVRTGHRSVRRNIGPWKHDVTKPWQLISHKKICKLLGQQVQLYSGSCVYKSILSKMAHKFCLKYFFPIFSLYFRPFLSQYSRYSPSSFHFKCPSLHLSGTFSL